MIIAQSFRRKVIVTIIAAGGFASLYEATILDSKDAARRVTPDDGSVQPAPGDRLAFRATAYCKGLTTASGVAVRAGIAAADPTLLPVGSVVDVAARNPKYSGIYTIMDTGPAVKGRLIDIYMWSCYEALDFGRMPIDLTVLRLGWNPQATTPSFFERMFKRPAATPTVLPSRPLPQSVIPPPVTVPEQPIVPDDSTVPSSGGEPSSSSAGL
jgi:3D (Asp-Asp-Asp) domain-containing protein